MRDTPGVADGGQFQTDVPARLDRLPWSGFHWRVVVALGITWILDGLEVTLVGSLAAAIHQSPSLALTETQVGLTASAYLVGAVGGALYFGWLADRIGRRRLFFITLIIYMLASIATGFAWDFWSFALFRALTGAGIGGEYAAVNSAIQELIPARRRGVTDLCVNGTFWGGAAIGAAVALVVLDPALVDPEIGWRGAFVVGGLLSVVVLALRRYLPESPRWLMLHGRPEEAERIVGDIEREVAARHGPLPPLELREVCRKYIKDAIEKIEGVASATITGGEEREILVEIDQARLRASQVAIVSVVDNVRAANINYPAGTIKESFYEYLIRTIGEYQKISEIQDTPTALDAPEEAWFAPSGTDLRQTKHVWRAVYDEPGGVTALEFYRKLRWQKWTRCRTVNVRGRTSASIYPTKCSKKVSPLAQSAVRRSPSAPSRTPNASTPVCSSSSRRAARCTETSSRKSRWPCSSGHPAASLLPTPR